MKEAIHPPALGWLRDTTGKIIGRSGSSYNPLPFAARADLQRDVRELPPAQPLIELGTVELLERNLRAVKAQADNPPAIRKGPTPSSPPREVARSRKGG